MISVGKEAAIYEGVVTHSRLKPVRHDLRYRVFSFLLDLDRITETADRLRFFSRGKFNLFSFHDRDHGAGRPENLAAYIRISLRAAGLNAGGRILLHCYPRMLGYAFNPLAVYYCYDATDRLSAMVYEVNNTFGDRHAYLVPVEGSATANKTICAKRVSRLSLYGNGYALRFCAVSSGRKTVDFDYDFRCRGRSSQCCIQGEARTVDRSDLEVVVSKIPANDV